LFDSLRNHAKTRLAMQQEGSQGKALFIHILGGRCCFSKQTGEGKKGRREGSKEVGAH